MASGPRNLKANRFALLDPGPKKKRKNGTVSSLVNFPMLPELTIEDPKFVVVESLDTSKPLSSFSPFAVHRGIRQVSSDVHSISTLRDGKLLLLVKSNTIAQKFIKTKQLVNVCAISASLHGSLNHVKGTVFAPFLNSVSEEEIVKELSSQGVVSAFKLKKNFDGILKPPGVVLLTFNLYNLPNKIDIAWSKFLVREYFPSPMRCKDCQLLGHTAKYCKGSPVCANCSLPPHSPTNCTRVFCANCKTNHSSSSKECPKFLQAKEILKIKTTKKCSIKEALKIYKQSTFPLQVGGSYASITVSNSNIEQQINTTTKNNDNVVKTPTSNIKTNKKVQDKENTNNENDNKKIAFNGKELPPSPSPTVDTTQAIVSNLPTSKIEQSNNHTSSPLSNSLNSAALNSSISRQFDSPTQTITPNSSSSQINSLFTPLPSLTKILATQDELMTDEETL